MTAALLRMVHLMLKSRRELANALYPIIISDGLCLGARPPVGDSRSSRRGCSKSVVLSSIWYRRSKHGRCSADLRPGCGASGPCATATQVTGGPARRRVWGGAAPPVGQVPGGGRRWAAAAPRAAAAVCRGRRRVANEQSHRTVVTEPVEPVRPAVALVTVTDDH